MWFSGVTIKNSIGEEEDMYLKVQVPVQTSVLKEVNDKYQN
jgi:hypothetical protein